MRHSKYNFGSRSSGARESDEIFIPKEPIKYTRDVFEVY